MARWDNRIVGTSYRFVRVDRSTGEEVCEIRALRGGSISRNDDTRIKESAEVGIVGDADFGPDLVRVYMGAEWPGETASVVLGTFLPSIPGRSVNQLYSTGTLHMSGRLQELLDDQFGSPVTVGKGEVAVERAAEVIEGAGLEVVAEESDYRVTENRYYGVGADQNNSQVGSTKLDMVNDLLDLAGFRAAYTDPMGRVILEKYRDPDEIAPSWSFVEGPSAKFEWSMTEEKDSSSTANHVVVVYGPNEDGERYIGEAWDRDPESPLSTVSRGRTITKSYSYTDMPPGSSAEERQKYANDRAGSLLSTAQSVIWRVNMRHAYAPIAVNDTAELRYQSGGIDGKFQVRAMRLALSGGCPTETELRRFRRRSNWKSRSS